MVSSWLFSLRRRWLVVGGIVLGLLLGGPALVRSAAGGEPSVIHACVNPSKLVRIVEPAESCHPSERALAWPAALATPQGAAVAGPLTVVDKAGKLLGPLVRPEGVALAVNGEWVLVGVQASRLYGLAGVAFYFREQNCTGERLVSPASELLPWVQVLGSTGYYAGRDGLPYAVGSMLFSGSSASSTSCYNNTAPYPTYTLTPPKTVDLGGFTPPFTVQ
jgi:hypothetical protein